MGKKTTDSRKIDEIRDLRRQGHSLPEISKFTGVSKTTVFRYIKGVEILPEFLSEWAGKRGGSRIRKRIKVKLAFEEGVEFIGKLSDRDKLIILSVLYWAEGSKKDFALSNTDPGLIKVYVNILRDTLKIESNRIKVSVRIYEDLDREKCLSFWSKIVDIPIKEFVNVNILYGKKKGKLSHGMCRVRVLKGGDILKKINGINKAIENIYAPIA